MRFYQYIFIMLFVAVVAGCGGQSAPKAETPLDVLKAYTQAIKRKDTTTMKLLLSEGSIKMAEEEAKAQNVTLDEIIKRETLFTENQDKVEFKNQKIEGDRATIEVRNSFGSWDIVPFVKEDGEWKIAKERYLEEQMKKTEEDMKRLDQQINQGAPDSTMPSPDLTNSVPSPSSDMTNPVPPPASDTTNPASAPPTP
jgi:hypothetical protein